MIEEGCQSSQSGMPSQVSHANPCISSSLRGIGNLDDSAGQQIIQSHPLNARNGNHRDLLHRLPRRRCQTSYVTDAELGADSGASNDGNGYTLIIKTLNLEGEVAELVASVDTGSPGNFILVPALDKIGRVSIYPIPEGNLKSYTTLLNPMEKIVPRHFLRLPLWNDTIGLNGLVPLKIFELPRSSGGLHIILGQPFLRKHGGFKFLAKVMDTDENNTQSADVSDESFGTLLKGKAFKSAYLYIQR